MTTVPASLALAASTGAAVRSPTVRALLQSGYGGTEVLRVGTVPRPVPGDAEVLVRVRAAGVDRGTWHLMTGRPYLMRVMGFGLTAPVSPVAGLDLAGEVVEVGPGVTRFRVGDHVFGIGRGSFAELAVAREDKLALAPSGLPLEDAAVLGVSGITALQALVAAGTKAGDRVLVIGASGGVGTFAVQIAKALGASVTGVCSAEKAALVRELGADRVLDYRTEGLDGGAPYDVVLDIAGNTPLARLRRAMTPEGRLVFVGGENGGDWTAGMGRPLLAMGLGLFVRQRFVMLASEERHTHLERVAQLCEAGQLRPVIDRRIDLAEVPAALADLEAGRVRGKVLVRVADVS